jgi:hypothetical protein
MICYHILYVARLQYDDRGRVQSLSMESALEGDGSRISTTLHFAAAAGLPAADSAFASANGCMQVGHLAPAALAVVTYAACDACQQSSAKPGNWARAVQQVRLSGRRSLQFANGERCAVELSWEQAAGSSPWFGGSRKQAGQHHPAAPFPNSVTVSQGHESQPDNENADDTNIVHRA